MCVLVSLLYRTDRFSTEHSVAEGSGLNLCGSGWSGMVSEQERA